MNSGVYAALSGSLVAMRKLDVLANNLANVNTAGFKKDRLTFESLLPPVGTPSAGRSDAPVLANERLFTDFSPGPQRESGNPLDLALAGDGFFVVETPEGRRYTRQGNFSRDTAGQLVTAEGYPVRGTGGPLTISGGHIDINDKGEIRSDGIPVGTLEIVDFPRPYALEKLGNALFAPADPELRPQPIKGTAVRQGILEGANVEAVTEMIQLIETNRYFEACQKVIRSYDDLAAKAANELGRV
jgi:flagellar basal-body rod protein FlgG